MNFNDIKLPSNCADCGKEPSHPRSHYCSACRPQHICPDCKDTPSAIEGCERCGSMGELPPPLTKEQLAKLIAKAEHAVAELHGGEKLTPKQIERFIRIYYGEGKLTPIKSSD